MPIETKDIVLEFGEVAKVVAVQFANCEWGNIVAPLSNIPYRSQSASFQKELTGRTIDQFDEAFITPAVNGLFKEVLRDYGNREGFLIKFLKPEIPNNFKSYRYLETNNISVLVSDIIDPNCDCGCEGVEIIRIDVAYRFVRRSNYVTRN